MSLWDRLWIDAHLATMAPGEAPYGTIRDGALAVRDGRIAWLGPRTELPGTPGELAREVRSAGGGWMTPGLVDCHSHLVFAGDRSDEFERRLEGASYREIAASGGGILATVRATRAASEGVLVDTASRRLQRLVDEGVTTVEIKSGYGLETATELRMLRAARRLVRPGVVDVRTTFLGVHAVPSEYVGRRGAYVDLVVEEMIPAVAEAGAADAVDAFLEDIAFGPDDVARVFEAARRHGMAVRLHADQLSDGGGAALAARHGARSADHLEYASEAGARAMGRAGTVAVLLPGAYLTLRGERAPPVSAFRREGVPMALATDANPGSSPLLSLLLTMNLGCTLFGMTPEEALAGVTRHAARVLGLEADRGTLAPGKRADLAVWNVSRPAELAYWMGWNPLREAVKDGTVRSTSRATRAPT